MLKRIEIDAELDKLSFGDLHKFTGAVAALEELMDRGLIVMVVSDLKGSGRLRKKRSDAKVEDDRKLYPQAAAVLEALTDVGEPITATRLSEVMRINETSVRAQLTFLERRGLAFKAGKVAETEGARLSIQWALVPPASVPASE